MKKHHGRDRQRRTTVQEQMKQASEKYALELQMRPDMPHWQAAWKIVFARFERGSLASALKGARRLIKGAYKTKRHVLVTYAMDNMWAGEFRQFIFTYFRRGA